MQFVLLLVEGPHDVEFLGQLLRHMDYRRLRDKRDVASFWTNLIPTRYPVENDLEDRMPTPIFYGSDSVSVAIKSTGGVDRFITEARGTLKLIDSPQAVGFFLDADTKLGIERHAELQERLSEQTSIVLPNTPGEVQSGPPRCGSYIFPDNNTPGTLEHILVECANIQYRNLLGEARKFVGNAMVGGELTPTELRGLNKPQGPTKAALCCVASALKPAQTIHASIRSDRWINQESLSLPLVAATWDFVERLIGNG